MHLRTYSADELLRGTSRLWHETIRTLLAAVQTLTMSSSSTPILNAQGQPIRSALKTDDDVSRTPPTGPTKGKLSQVAP